MQYMFLSCLKATELIEKKLHFKLSFTEKLRLKVHSMMCKACASFDKQTTIIEKGVEKNVAETAKGLSIDLKAFEESIIKRIEDHQAKIDQ